jgi:hypothetical protein
MNDHPSSQPPSSQPAITANITAGNIPGQIAIGSNNQLTQQQIQAPSPVTAAEREELHRLFDQLRHQVQAETPPEKQAPALERVDELEAAIAEAKPDLTTMDYVKRWFAKHLPKLSGTVTGIVIHPIVGKLVEAAGDMAAAEFRSRFGAD